MNELTYLPSTPAIPNVFEVVPFFFYLFWPFSY